MPTGTAPARAIEKSALHSIAYWPRMKRHELGQSVDYERIRNLAALVTDTLWSPDLDDAARDRILAAVFARSDLQDRTACFGMASCLVNPGARSGQPHASGAHPRSLAHAARLTLECLHKDSPAGRGRDLPRLPDGRLVAVYLLEHPQLPSDFFAALAEAAFCGGWRPYAGALLQESAVRHPGCPVGLLERGALSSFEWVRAAALGNPLCPDHARIAAALIGQE